MDNQRKQSVRALRSEDNALTYLRENDGVISVFWATESLERARALKRLEKKELIAGYEPLQFPFGKYAFVSEAPKEASES